MTKKTNNPDDVPLMELEDINFDELDETGKQIYRTMEKQWRDQWLRKNNERAKQLKTQEDEMGKLRGELERAHQELQSFYVWWEREGQFMTPREQTAAMKRHGLEDPQETVDAITQLRQDFSKAAQQYNTVIEQLGQRNTMLENALKLQHDLFDLRFRHPDMDTERVLTLAKEKGITNLDLAYQLAYGDENRAREIDQEVTRRLEEEQERWSAERTIAEHQPSTARYAPPEEPKGYAEASEGILKALRTKPTV